MSLNIIPTAEPFYIPGGQIGVLLVHGFTGTPKEMRWMGEYLAQKGHSVLGVRLAGHATQPEDLLRLRWRDWLTSVEDGYSLLRESAPKIVVAGLSMGGILSLIFASHFEISGVIAMSTPYEMPPDPRLRLIRLLRWILPRVPKGKSDWADSNPENDHIDYPYYPTKPIIELQGLIAEMQSALPRITAPVLLMHASHDGSISPDNMEKIYAKLGTNNKEMRWIVAGGHMNDDITYPQAMQK